MHRFFQSKRKLLAAALLGFGLLAIPITGSRTYAAFTACDTDPIISLSNGSQLKVKASIFIPDPLGITSIQYEVHIPAGTQVNSIAYLGYTGMNESVNVIADDPANTYDTYTTVNTLPSNIFVLGQTSLSGTSGQRGAVSYAIGVSGQTLHARVLGSSGGSGDHD